MPDKRSAQIEDRFKHTQRGLRKRTAWYHVAIGPDPGANEIRGYARGFIAIGDDATGVIAIGWVAKGLVAIGGCAIGCFAFGVLSIGAVLAAGGLALGSLAFGGVALGGVAIGFEAGGFYACGANARGAHVVEDDRRDPEAIVFFAERGLAAACGQDNIRGKSL